jgi:hypothetical protein
MVTPDYQEFANPANAEYRDNTVICAAHASGTWRNQPGVARLPRHKTSTKAELSADVRAIGAVGATIAGDTSR